MHLHVPDELYRDLEEPPCVKKPRLSAETDTVTNETKDVLLKHILDSGQQHLDSPQ